MHRGISHDNDRSYLYEYDNLHRLTWAGRGQLSTDNSTLLDTIPTTSAWQLDNLGNWSGGVTGRDSFVRTGDFDGDGVPDTKDVSHTVDNANMIQSLYEDGVETSFVYDFCGNLVYDGKRYYQYDAWNRLIQVNLLGTAVIDPYDGRIDDLGITGVDSEGNPIGGLGDLLCRYSYDGLGRLIRKETPVNEGSTYLQRKDFYYDGVRRIEEVIFRPTETPDGIDTRGTAFAGDGDVENDELNLERQDGSDPTQQIESTVPRAVWRALKE